MKKKNIVLVLITGVIMLTSCGTLMRKTFGTTEEDLIKTVSLEQGCPKENIKILDKIQTLGNATYSLDVCGKKITYKQIGSVFMTAERADKILKK